MPSAKKPEIATGQNLDLQPGVANIGENRATLEALRNANIDGQDVYPQSVSTKRFSADDGLFSGNIMSGGMLVGAGGVTITSDTDLGTPATGLHISDSTLRLLKSGVAQVTLDGATGDATFIGAITATSGTFTGSIEATDGFFVGTITIGTSETVGGSAAGMWLTDTRLLMKYGGTTKVDFNTSADTYYMKGEVYAEKFTVIPATSGSNAVNFGANVTIGGNLIINTADATNQITFGDTSNFTFISYTHTTGQAALSASESIRLVAQGGFGDHSTLLLTRGGEANLLGYTNTTIDANGDVTITTGAGATDNFSIVNGTGEVMHNHGNSLTTTWAGFMTTVGFSSSAGIYGAHKTVGGSALADGTYTLAGGGTFTMTDGIVTATNGSGPT